MKKLFAATVALQAFLYNGALLAQDVQDAPPGQSMMQTFVMVAIAMLFFYFILLRPEQKRRKALEAQRNAIKKGDKVIAMGIIGTVNRIQDQSVILTMVDGAKIEVLKGAITEVVPEPTVEVQTVEKK